MPWWSWVLIWGGLVLALLGMLAYLGWRLFRKAATAFEELSQLAEKTELLDAMADDPDAHAFTPSILRDRKDVATEHRLVGDARASRRDARRDNRKTKGRLLVAADYRDAASRIKGV